jgi:fatty acid desaturase
VQDDKELELLTDRKGVRESLVDTVEMKRLIERSDAKGLGRLLSHLAGIALAGWLVFRAQGSWLLVPAMVMQGLFIVTLFAALHESVHYTAFRSRKLNELIGWLVGLPILFNSTFYRQFHYAHHRFTQIPGRDPELFVRPPDSLWRYIERIVALQYWGARIAQTYAAAMNDYSAMPFIPKGKRKAIQRSVWLMILVYGVLLIGSLAAGSASLVWYWLLPVLMAQPILRFWLVAEHTGCTENDDPLTNTRTTRTNALVRYLMWNMPFHAEHHLYPQVPFHALPRLNSLIGESFRFVAPSYIDTNAKLLTELVRRERHPVT